jgi:hypothetical protein
MTLTVQELAGQHRHHLDGLNFPDYSDWHFHHAAFEIFFHVPASFGPAGYVFVRARPELSVDLTFWGNSIEFAKFTK